MQNGGLFLSQFWYCRNVVKVILEMPGIECVYNNKTDESLFQMLQQKRQGKKVDKSMKLGINSNLNFFNGRYCVSSFR
jgi:hypothetical protein